jgi:hypothetical protein
MSSICVVPECSTALAGEMDGSEALGRGKTGVMDGSDTSPSEIGSSVGSLRKRIRTEHNISSQYIHKNKEAG